MNINKIFFTSVAKLPPIDRYFFQKSRRSLTISLYFTLRVLLKQQVLDFSIQNFLPPIKILFYLYVDQIEKFVQSREINDKYKEKLLCI